MSNKRTLILFAGLWMLSGCAEIPFLNQFFAPGESSDGTQAPGVYLLTDRQVCAQALDLTSSPPAWEVISNAAEFVQEAQRRNLSADACAGIFGLGGN